MVNRLALAALAFLLPLVALGAVSAQAPSEVERQIAQGEALFEAGNFDAALAEFDSAYALLEGDPTRYYLLWNIGQCHERLFHYDRALAYYQRYLDEGGPGAEDRATVEATMRALDGLLARVEVSANVEGASIWVDGHEVDVVPATIRVPGGTHRVEVRAEGHTAEVREIQLAARGTLRIEIVLHVVSDFEGLEPWLFWTSGGVALVSALVGAGVGIAALVDSSNVTARDRQTRSEEDRVRSAGLALGADVLYGVAGLFATTALVLAFLTDWDDGPPRGPTATLLPVIGADGFGLALGGTW